MDIELSNLLNILVHILLLRPFWLVHFFHPNIGGWGRKYNSPNILSVKQVWWYTWNISSHTETVFSDGNNILQYILPYSVYTLLFPVYPIYGSLCMVYRISGHMTFCESKKIIFVSK